jgi:malonyl-CoA/methylmalonyl-CoA synthetase
MKDDGETMMSTIVEAFRTVAEAGDAPFLMLPDGGVISYAEAYERSGKLANQFTALGIVPGDRIALQADKSADALLVYLAALRMGAVFLPLNTAYTVEEVSYFLNDATPKLFICRPEDETRFGTLCAQADDMQCLSLGTANDGSLMALASAQPAAFDDVICQPSDLAAILYTSGTTGRSKGAMLSHGNLASNAWTLRSLWGFSSEDRLLHALPIFHTHGLFVATNTILCARAAMIFLPRFDVDELLRWMPEATTMMGVPTFYTRLLDDPRFTRASAEHMRLFISGSAPLSAETHRTFARLTGHAILERYGMTETNMITSNPLDGARVPGSVGLPLPGVEVRVADPETAAVLPVGEIGVLEVRGPNVFQGYWRMPDKTREDFRADGYFITGDLGLIDDRGYVHIVGRAKDLIISGGFNVYPAEVEALLDEIPGVAESAVVGVPHPDFGEGVVAVISSQDSAVDEDAILAALEGRLARFKQPKRVIFVPELPRNAMGKVQKAQLREQFSKLFE